MTFTVKYNAYTESEIAAQNAGSYNWDTPKEKEIEHVTADTAEQAIEAVKQNIENNIRNQETRRKADHQATTEQKLFFQFDQMDAVRAADGVNVRNHPGTRDERIVTTFTDFSAESED